MKKIRQIAFKDEDACIADVQRLRKGYRAGGNWTLEQVCWHVGAPISPALHEPADVNVELTPHQRKVRPFVDQVIASGWPAGLPSPKEIAPPERAEPAAIDGFIDVLQQLKSYKAAQVETSVFGPLATEQFRRFVLIHAGHHLGFLEPTSG